MINSMTPLQNDKVISFSATMAEVWATPQPSSGMNKADVNNEIEDLHTAMVLTGPSETALQRSFADALSVKIENVLLRLERLEDSAPEWNNRSCTGDKLKDQVAKIEESLQRQVLRANTMEEALQREANTKPAEVQDPAGNLSCNYILNESVWDAFTMLGTQELGFGSSVLLLIATSLNILIQGYICKVLWTEPSFSATDRILELLPYMHHWRVTDGHNINFMGSDDMNLVTRVCGLDSSLSLANGQSILLEEINSYLSLDLGQVETKNPGTGPLLCTVCIIFFALVVIAELRQVFFHALSLCKVPRTHMKTKMKDNSLSEISHVRLMLCLLLCLMRTIIAISLLACGVVWLCSTTSVVELILNAAALAFVMDIDEAVFAALMPEHVIQLVREHQPLPVETPPRLIDIFPVVLLVATSIIAHILFLSTNSENLLAVKRELCGGRTNFAYSLSSGLNLVFTRETNHMGQTYFEDIHGRNPSLLDKSVAELQHFVGDPTTSLVWSIFQDTTLFELLRDSTSAYFWDILFSEVGNIACIDRDRRDDTTNSRDLEVFWNSIREAANVRIHPAFGATFRCMDFKTECDVLDNVLLRMLCPQTCGCSDSASGLYLMSSTVGCPSGCSEVAVSRLREESACDDINLNSLAEQNSWNRYWQAWEAYEKSVVTTANRSEDYALIRNHMISKGCDGVFTVNAQRELLDYGSSASTFQDIVDVICSNVASMQQVGGPASLTVLGFCPSTCCSLGLILDLDRPARKAVDGCPKACDKVDCSWFSTFASCPATRCQWTGLACETCPRSCTTCGTEVGCDKCPGYLWQDGKCGATCDTKSWSDVGYRDIDCGRCEVLATSMQNDGKYNGSCANYCAAHGLDCVSQKEDVRNTCLYEWVGDCHIPGKQSGADTPDLICQCSSNMTCDTNSTRHMCIGHCHAEGFTWDSINNACQACSSGYSWSGRRRASIPMEQKDQHCPAGYRRLEESSEGLGCCDRCVSGLVALNDGRQRINECPWDFGIDPAAPGCCLPPCSAINPNGHCPNGGWCNQGTCGRGGNHYRYEDGARSMGGDCTCPDGQTYEVGAYNSGCDTLACEGGSPGPCKERLFDGRQGMKVTCAHFCARCEAIANSSVCALCPECYWSGEACIPFCTGDPTGWNAGHGGCATYAAGLLNSRYCESDYSDLHSAKQVCEECGLCKNVVNSSHIVNGTSPSIALQNVSP